MWGRFACLSCFVLFFSFQASFSTVTGKKGVKYFWKGDESWWSSNISCYIDNVWTTSHLLFTNSVVLRMHVKLFHILSSSQPMLENRIGTSNCQSTEYWGQGEQKKSPQLQLSWNVVEISQHDFCLVFVQGWLKKKKKVTPELFYWIKRKLRTYNQCWSHSAPVARKRLKPLYKFILYLKYKILYIFAVFFASLRIGEKYRRWCQYLIA